LSTIGGSSKANLRDDGRRGDDQANDGIYTVDFQGGGDFKSGSYSIPVTANLADGRTLTQSAVVKLVSEDEEGRASFLPGFDGVLVITALLIVTMVLVKRSKA
jgi:hypothetical protein